ncbi:MAG: PIN domain-containing protein [Desulfosarcina sp.]|nr:PIN domain-containing protein [Desulfobacterales bacterium]
MDENRKFFSIFSVVEPTQKDLWKSIHYSRKFDVFANDALSLCLMKRLNLTYIATADKDFSTVGWLKIVEGDWINS